MGIERVLGLSRLVGRDDKCVPEGLFVCRWMWACVCARRIAVSGAMVRGMLVKAVVPCAMVVPSVIMVHVWNVPDGLPGGSGVFASCVAVGVMVSLFVFALGTRPSRALEFGPLASAVSVVSALAEARLVRLAVSREGSGWLRRCALGAFLCAPDVAATLGESRSPASFGLVVAPVGVWGLCFLCSGYAILHWWD